MGEKVTELFSGTGFRDKQSVSILPQKLIPA